MKFLVPNYSCFQDPLSSTEFVEPPPNKIPGYATDVKLKLTIPLNCTVLKTLSQKNV